MSVAQQLEALKPDVNTCTFEEYDRWVSACKQIKVIQCNKLFNQ